jgi:hypothetical protein
MLTLFRIIATLSMIALTSCKSLYDLKGYSKAPLKGVMTGKEWAFAYGYTDPEADLPDGMEMMIVLTTAKPKHACPDESDRLADAREVAITVDGKPGEMRIGGASGKYETEDDLFTYKKTERKASVAFHDPSRPESQQYMFAKTGKVKITKITATTVEGAVVAKIDPEHFVNGKFKARICKYGQLN